MEKLGKDDKSIDKFRRELIKISVFSAPVLSLISPLKKVQAVTEPGGGDIPAPRFEKLKKEKKSSTRRLFEKSPFKNPLKNPLRNPSNIVNSHRRNSDPEKTPHYED